MLLDLLRGNYDWTVRKMSIDVLYTFAAILKEAGVAGYKSEIMEVLQETRTDKIKPVRDASLEAINAVRDLIDLNSAAAKISPRPSMKSLKKPAEAAVKKQSPPRNVVAKRVSEVA